jgi:hypothetical protein
MSMMNNIYQSAATVTFTGVTSALIGAATAVAAKGVLEYCAISVLTGSYGNVALLGAKVFASLLVGTALGGVIQNAVDYKPQSCSWISMLCGTVAVIPVVWLSAIPVTTALALAALNICLSRIVLSLAGFKPKKISQTIHFINKNVGFFGARTFRVVETTVDKFSDVLFVSFVGGALGTITPLIAKVALNALPGFSYVSAALLGARLFGAFASGAALFQVLPGNGAFLALSGGILTTASVIWLTSVPVISALWLTAVPAVAVIAVLCAI